MAPWRIIAAAGALVWSLGPGMAQDDLRVGLGRCAAIAGDADRLKCFDQMARPAVPAPGGATIWEVQTETSPVDDSRIVQVAQKPLGPWGDLSITLQLRCIEGRTVVQVSRDTLLAVGRSVKVITRIGTQRATESQWTVGNTSQEAVLTDNPIGFLRSLPTSGRLFIRVEGVREQRFEGIFRLDGLAEIRRNLGEACRWPAPPR